MDIVNFDALKAQGRIIDPSQVNPEEDYFIIGKYTNHYSTNSQKYTKYPVFAIKAGDVMGNNLAVESVTGLNTNNTDPQNPIVQIAVDGVTVTGLGTLVSPLVSVSTIPTLQQVLDFNHDLVDGNNFQGTGAGSSATGDNINAFGTDAATNNTGRYVNAIGNRAALDNGGNEVTAIGRDAALNNQSNFVTGIGYGAASDNRNGLVNAIGRFAAAANEGSSVNAMGFEAARSNIGNNVIAIGDSAGNSNQADNVIAIGAAAGIGNPIPGMFIISNSSMPFYADFAAASAAISATGIAGNTYLYYDQGTSFIGAVRL